MYAKKHGLQNRVMQLLSGASHAVGRLVSQAPTMMGFGIPGRTEIYGKDAPAQASATDIIMELNSNQIQEIIPHRFPFQLIDRVTEYEPGKFARGIKCVSVNEPFFCGHFPEEHVMPGVLIIEAMAQAGAVAILSLPENQGKIAFFGGIKNARFKRKVIPGDVLTLECTLTKQLGPVGIGRATATVDGELAAEAELTFAIGAKTE